MLKVIKRVLRLSGDLSKRIYASFVFSFIPFSSLHRAFFAFRAFS